MSCDRLFGHPIRQKLRCFIGLCIAGVAVFNGYIATYYHHHHHIMRETTRDAFAFSASHKHINNLGDGSSSTTSAGSQSSSLMISSPSEQQRAITPIRRRVLFVHIGKTGGETIRQTLRVACFMRQNPMLQQSCLDKFQNDHQSLGQTPLNQQTIGTIHCLLMVPANALKRATTLLVSLRNPIERVISWFRYLHPANCNPKVDKQSTACNVKKALRREKKEARKRRKNNKKVTKQQQSWTTRFFTCFDSLPQVGLALQGGGAYHSNNNSSNNNNCSVLAQKTIRGAASPISSHMHFNYEYYWNQTLTLRPELETMAVRTEALWEDLDHVQSLLHTNNGNDDVKSSTNHTTQYKLPPRNNHTHGSESHRHVDSISGPALQYLCCALSREIYVYAEWIHRAVNLEQGEKQRAMEGVTKYCNISSSSSAYFSDDDGAWIDLALLQSTLCDSQTHSV